MAVTKIEVGGNFYMTYPSGYVFGRERNYLILEEYGEQVYINSIQFIKGNVVKELNFGSFDLLKNKKLIIDISAYYSFGFEEIGYNYTDMDGTIFNDRLQLVYTFLDCYDPFKELVPTHCGVYGDAYITPPSRMLYNDDEDSEVVKTIFIAKNIYPQGFSWEIDGIKYSSIIVMESINIPFDGGGKFTAKYIRNSDNFVLANMVFQAGLLDRDRDFVYVTWRTRWGANVTHIFYLDKYTTDKDDANEVESIYNYEEYSKHVVKGSFYLDNITDPYDLFYYQTLAHSELVTITFIRWDIGKELFMPNGTNAFNGVKIKGSNIKDAVVDGVTQSTISFNFELR